MNVGIIGGSGIGERLARLPGPPMFVATPHGMLRGRALQHEGTRIFAVSRHSAGHKVPPHRVGYQALAEGMRAAGVRACLATAAVGSLRSDWGPGTFVACSDFLDLTSRNLTLFDETVVHTDFSQPFGPGARRALIESAEAKGIHIEGSGVYVGGNGPRYETPAEIEAYRRLGGEVVGMTASTEAVLMREAGVEYGCLAIVSNLACGITDMPLSHDEVILEMGRSGGRAIELLLDAARRIANTV